MVPRPPVLIICSIFPPCPGIGGRRWAKFAKALAARGHTVHVLHAACTGDDRRSLWTDDIAHPRIIRHPLPPRYPLVLRKWPLTSLMDKLSYRFWRTVVKLVVKGNWMDRSALWRPTLLNAADALIRTHGIRHVVATGAPFHLLVHTLELRERHPGLRTVVDLRDPWTWGDIYGMRSLSPRRMRHEHALERRAIRGHDRVLAPARAILDHLRATYPDAADRLDLLPHPVDPDDRSVDAAVPDDGLFRVVYAGSLYAPVLFEAFLEKVMASFDRLRRTDPARFERVRYDAYVIGDPIEPLARKVAAAGLSDRITFHEPIPPKALNAQLQRADLVLIFMPPEKKDILTTKFSELFQMRAPILHVGEPGAVSTAITEGGHGRSVRLEELESELTALLRGERVVEVRQDAEDDANALDTLCTRLEAILFTTP